ncbi:MAG: hypothetical protein FWE21_04270 [Defluviitaleaceae bacterium]|nr:hypothetical protein [Defluviitaleaceae bacterium]
MPAWTACATPIDRQLNEANEAEFAAFMEYHIATCQQPSILGHSAHGLWIGKKIM